MTSLKWIDITKGIGILLVIMGHNDFGSLSKTIIYTFHMPLFFFINGYLFHYVKYKQDTYGFIKGKFKRLVIPYFLTNIAILCTFTFLFSLKLFSSFNANSPVENLIGILYGNVPSEKIASILTNSIDVPSWFLLSLFCASLILYLIAYSHEIYGLAGSIILNIFIILFGYVISRYVFMPWGIDIACVSMIFMFSGYLINYYKISWPSNKSKSKYFFFISILLLVAIITINGSVDMSLRRYSNLALFGIGGLLGTYVITTIAKKISISENVLIRTLVFLGKNSIIIFLF